MSKLGKAREFELLAAKIQAALSPNATVLHDQRLRGRKTNSLRQIDVLIQDKIGQYSILIVMECKDYSRPVDVKSIEEFQGLVDDVGAHRAVMVAAGGFSETAKSRARGLQMELYSPVDTDPHAWQAKITLPSVCDLRSAAISFRISSTYPGPLRISPDFFSSKVAYSKDGIPLGIPSEIALKRWNNGDFPNDPGLYEDQNIFDYKEVMIDNGYGTLQPASLSVSLAVNRELRFGYIPVEKMSGFRDELSGGIITNAFKTGVFDVKEVIESWNTIDSIEDLPNRPVLILEGLIGYDPETKVIFDWRL